MKPIFIQNCSTVERSRINLRQIIITNGKLIYMPEQRTVVDVVYMYV